MLTNPFTFKGWYGHSLVAQLQEYKPNEGKDLEDTLCEDINYIKQRLSNTAKGQAVGHYIKNRSIQL